MDKENIILTVGHHDRTSFIVSIETITRRGIFQFDIIGLANKTVSESKQRILSAVGFSIGEKRHYINKKITTLLSPADSKKEGSHFDLPIALSYFISVKKSEIHAKNTNIFAETIFLGELNLTGFVLPIRNIHILIRAGIAKGIRYFVIPEGNMDEAKAIKDILVWPLKHISEILNTLGDNQPFDIDKFKPNKTNELDCDETGVTTNEEEKTFLLDSIKSQETAKRALEIALSGKHHILFIGTPGGGKSLLAKSSKELVPKFNPLEANIFQRQALNESGELSQTNTIHFREPHHTSNYSEIIGNRFLYGEIVLAHTGILFMDEFIEFDRRVLEALRQPMENKYIQKNQSGLMNSSTPTDFILIACMNSCDCGFSSSDYKKCVCTQSQLDKYRRKLNSPLFQRFDICVHIQQRSRPGHKKHENKKMSPKLSAIKIKKTVEKVRAIQSKRQQNIHNLSEEKAQLTQKCKDIINQISARFNFSMREEFSLLRVARTIADIEDSVDIKEEHILEASSYTSSKLSDHQK